MVFTADYPVVGVLWTMMIFVCWVAWVWPLIVIFLDVFGREVSGWAEAAWVVSVIVLPLLGYVRSIVASTDGRAASEIRRAERLLDSGATTRQEFDSQRPGRCPGPGRDRDRRPGMTVHSGARWGGSEPGSLAGAPDAGPAVVLGARAGVPVVILAGAVDRELIERADPMLQHLTLKTRERS